MPKQFHTLSVLTLVVTLCFGAYGQSETTGFYVVLDKKKECTNPFKSLTISIPLCLSKAPIIAEEDFESVSDVYTDSTRSTKYINLKISKEAYGKFQLMAKKLPKTNLALVVDGTIVGIIDNLESVSNPIPIFSTLHSTDVEWVYQRLKRVKNGEKL